ncbi:5' nucleotidase, NT5C type [Paraglaciecola sp.]|uniref:5' nucleotidase, NT5C type n=1 Tax=Paraglaciecola sp. TaxID=1920173 RepID=UPI003EF70092
MAKKSIAIDMDDTVADTLSRHLDWYKNEFGISLERQDMLGKKIYDVVAKEHLTAVKKFPHHPEFFKDLPVFENAVEVIKELSQTYTIYFASAAMEYPSSFTAKHQWLKKHFPFINDLNFIFCGYKGMLNCDFLIDDSSCHIDAFCGQGLLFDAVHNHFEQGYDKVANWLEVKSKLLG